EPDPYGSPSEEKPGVDAEGSDVDVQGPGVGVEGSDVDVQGPDVGGEGPNADVEGSDVGGSPAWTSEGTSIELGPSWEMGLVPTLEDTWGDFTRPGGSGSPVERWELRHRVETDGDDGRSDGWAAPGHDDAAWEAAYATFGPHALATGPEHPGELPG